MEVGGASPRRPMTRAARKGNLMDDKLNAIDVGYQAYLEEGGDPFGAVRRVAPDGVTVYIENGGDFSIGAAAVRSVHDGKVVLDRERLDPSIIRAIKHAHDREEPGL
jgi:hypothetical protein